MDDETRAQTEKEKLADEKLSKFEAIQAERKRLPMFPYREELLAAIEEHQVSPNTKLETLGGFRV